MRRCFRGITAPHPHQSWLCNPPLVCVHGGHFTWTIPAKGGEWQGLGEGACFWGYRTPSWLLSAGGPPHGFTEPSRDCLVASLLHLGQTMVCRLSLPASPGFYLVFPLIQSLHIEFPFHTCFLGNPRDGQVSTRVYRKDQHGSLHALGRKSLYLAFAQGCGENISKRSRVWEKRGRTHCTGRKK